MPEHLNLFAVVLAAGSSSRFGNTKQIHEINGQSLVARACDIARTACGNRCLLVTGHEWSRVLKAAGDTRPFHIINEHHEDGIGSSIAAAAGSLRQVADGILLLLGDQVLVEAADLEQLKSAWRDHPDSIIAAAYKGTLGPPVIFPAVALHELEELRGDQGAKQLLQSGVFEVISIEMENAGADIDTVDDLDKL